MNIIKAAIEGAGGPSKVAKELGVSVQSVCFYRDGERTFPHQYGAKLEQLSDGKYRRWDMFPADWHRVWPELIGTDGAPEIAPTETN